MEIVPKRSRLSYRYVTAKRCDSMKIRHVRIQLDRELDGLKTFLKGADRMPEMICEPAVFEEKISTGTQAGMTRAHFIYALCVREDQFVNIHSVNRVGLPDDLLRGLYA